MLQGSTHQSISPQSSATPLISSAQREAAVQDSDNNHPSGIAVEDKEANKNEKRRFLGFGRKKEEKQASPAMASSANAMPPPAPQEPDTTLRSPSPGQARAQLKPQVQPIAISPARNTLQANLATSPSRLRSASPRRVHSPASSEIFERNVQEPAQIVQLQGELSPAHIPSHVITEDHIPPALEVAAQAITSEELNPDEVEIVMSSSHQPAGSALEASTSTADLTQLNSPLSLLHHARSEDSEHASSMHQSGFLPPAGAEELDGASNYGQLDPTDVRRLSFISFADVVQSEHHAAPPHTTSAPASEAGGTRDNTGSQAFPSPRSPTFASAGGLATPPPPAASTGGLSLLGSNLEQSPPASSINLASPGGTHSELTIETMRQAVRKTASGDLSGVRTGGMSPVSEEHLAGVPRSRTNS